MFAARACDNDCGLNEVEHCTINHHVDLQSVTATLRGQNIAVVASRKGRKIRPSGGELVGGGRFKDIAMNGANLRICRSGIASDLITIT